MSGCNLGCMWCSNPEGSDVKQKLLYRKSHCKCNFYRCMDACKHKAIKKSENKITIDRNKCRECKTFDCVNVCYDGALAVSGKYYTPDELIEILNRDKSYWGDNGGVTFGGGDPLCQSKFVGQVLKKCRELSIHTAIETSAYGPTEDFLKLMQNTNWVFIDIKHIDPKKHKEFTGVDNKLILDNIKKLKNSGWGGTLVVRIPVICGFNDDEKNMSGIADFLKENKIDTVNLLSYHSLGTSKYEQLGLDYAFAKKTSPSKEKLNAISKIFQAKKISCYLNHDTPF